MADAVENGALIVDRFELTILRLEMLTPALEDRLPQAVLSFDSRVALIDDLVDIASRLSVIAGCESFKLRLLAEKPTEHCGFHVDTVVSSRPPFGLLKVYNGAGTYYVCPDDLTRTRDFYSYLGRRERLAREYREALTDRSSDAETALAEMRSLDERSPFLQAGSSVRQVPARAQVAFRLLDIRDMWTDHPSDRAWIHCSPMKGVARLVANFTPLDGRAARKL